MQETAFLRQMDICPPGKLQFPITIIGAGSIGSATALVLCKMGCGNITVWDDDALEEHNVPNQLCVPDAVGRSKVHALSDLVEDLTGVRVKINDMRYRGQKLRGMVIAAVDSMNVRKVIWDRVKLDTDVPLLIDARMGAEVGRIYCVRPCNIDSITLYEENLYTSDEAEQLPCSARAIIYCPVIMAGIVASQVKAFALDEPVFGEIVFDLKRLTFLTEQSIRR